MATVTKHCELRNANCKLKKAASLPICISQFAIRNFLSSLRLALPTKHRAAGCTYSGLGRTRGGYCGDSCKGALQSRNVRPLRRPGGFLIHGRRVVRVPSSEQTHTEEHRLIRAAQAGDRTAFAALVERYWDRLYRWLYRLTQDRHTAEDLAQESFLKALAGLSKFRAGTNFNAWLFRIAHNTFANYHRSAARRRE